MRRGVELALVVLAALLIAGAIFAQHNWAAPRADVSISQPAAKVDGDAMQALAAASCKCTRDGGGGRVVRDACWRDYETAVADLETYSMATACAPISTEIACTESDGVEACWVTSLGEGICTAEEAQAVERAYSEALNKEGDFDHLNEEAAQRANKRANAAIADILERIRRGESFAHNPTPDGCA